MIKCPTGAVASCIVHRASCTAAEPVRGRSWRGLIDRSSVELPQLAPDLPPPFIDLIEPPLSGSETWSALATKKKSQPVVAVTRMESNDQ